MPEDYGNTGMQVALARKGDSRNGADGEHPYDQALTPEVVMDASDLIIAKSADYIIENGITKIAVALKGGIPLTTRLFRELHNRSYDVSQLDVLMGVKNSGYSGYSASSEFVFSGEGDLDGEEVFAVDDIIDSVSSFKGMKDSLVARGAAHEKPLVCFSPVVKGHDAFFGKPHGLTIMDDENIGYAQLSGSDGQVFEGEVQDGVEIGYLYSVEGVWINAGFGMSSDKLLGQLRDMVEAVKTISEPGERTQALAQLGDFIKVIAEVDTYERTAMACLVGDFTDIDSYTGLLLDTVDEVGEERSQLHGEQIDTLQTMARYQMTLEVSEELGIPVGELMTLFGEARPGEVQTKEDVLKMLFDRGQAYFDGLKRELTGQD